jgi:hypothetical protein
VQGHAVRKLRDAAGGQAAAEVIADFEQWVKLGAPDPREPACRGGPPVRSTSKRPAQFWSFQPPQATPNAAGWEWREWSRRKIDGFVLAQLEDRGLAPAARPTAARSSAACRSI